MRHTLALAGASDEAVLRAPFREIRNWALALRRDRGCLPRPSAQMRQLADRAHRVLEAETARVAAQAPGGRTR